jgi:NAD-dependent deacetylase
MTDNRPETDAALDQWCDEIRAAAELIGATDRVAAFTGAGISVESGIPAFRGAQGLWEKYDPMEYAHIDGFLANPEKIWKMLLEMREVIENAQPNPAHYGLAELERMGHLTVVVTQNVDNLHQRAGSRNVVEYHGNGTRLVCLKCGGKYEAAEVDLSKFPPRCRCSTILKPDVVFYGELIPREATLRADEAARTCAVMLVVGTSGGAWPASDIPRAAKSHGAKIVEINIERTELTPRVTDHYIGASSGVVMPALVEEVKRIEGQHD